jgi:hypothetical protein
MDVIAAAHRSRFRPLGMRCAPGETAGMRDTIAAWKRAFVLAGLALLGCGGGSAPPPASCLQVSYACGGDITGTWRFLGACTADLARWTTSEQLRCAGASVSSVGFSASGSITFNADLTYTARGWQTNYDETRTTDLSCASGTTCADDNLSVNDTSSGSASKVTCTGTTACTCRTSYLTAISESGTYTAGGGDFGLTLVGATTSRLLSYCVQDGLLHVIQTAPTAADPSAPLMVMTDAVAERM